MKTLAVVLLVMGTVVGALGGGRLPKADLLVSALGLAMLAAGAVLFRLAAKRERDAAVKGDAEAGDPASLAKEALLELPDRVAAIAKEAPDLALGDIVKRLTEVERELFRPISDGAPRLLGVLGSARFAEVVGTYASGERLLYRAWSAAADGHRPEALDALERGAERVREAAQGLEPPAKG